MLLLFQITLSDETEVILSNEGAFRNGVQVTIPSMVGGVRLEKEDRVILVDVAGKRGFFFVRVLLLYFKPCT